jgi:ATP-dependent helicase IRC3
MRKLRPYQLKCLLAIKDAVAEGKKKMLVEMPTGAGKTFVFSQLPWLLEAKRTMVLAHRDELLKQAAEDARSMGFTVEIEKAESVASPDCQIVVASVQSLRNGRLAKFDPNDFDLIIIDECHHSACESYLRIVEHFNLSTILGFTATPFRSDQQNLLNVFTDGFVFEVGIEELIKGKYLTPVKTIEKKILSKFSPEHVFDAYDQNAKDLKTIIFCRNIEHSIDVAKLFLDKGVPAMPVFSGMGSTARESVLKRFTEGEIKVITNASLLSEGYNERSIQCVILARKVSSKVLKTQMIGRGLRLHENKSTLKVIELIPSKPVDWGMRLRKVWRIAKPLIWILLILTLSIWGIRSCAFRLRDATIGPPPVATKVEFSLHTIGVCELKQRASMKSKTVGRVGPLDDIVKVTETKVKDTTWAKITVNSNKMGWINCPMEMR